MIDLPAVLGPVAVSDFLADHWPDRLFHDETSPARAAVLASVPALSDPRAALAVEGRFGIFLGDGTVATTSSSEVALRHFDAGRTCFLHGDHVPELAALRDSVAHDLGLPHDAMRIEVFCSPGASGAPMHSDYDINMAVLVQGRKRWRVAPNEHVTNPVAQTITGSAPPDLALRLARRHPLPDRMPDDALTLDVGPGGMILLPRGWWHETETFEGECLQVNFAVKGPMQMTVVLRAVRELVLDRPEWRDYLVDAYLGAERAEHAAARLGALLPELVASLGELTIGRTDAEVGRELMRLAGIRPVRRPARVG